jgi:hypothetical protein
LSSFTIEFSLEFLAFEEKKEKKMTTMKTLAKKLPTMKDQTSYSKIAHLSTQNGQLDIIIDGLKVANCISRAPARSIIRHKDKIHFDVLFYSPSRHQNRNGRCIIIYFARLDPKAWWP